MLLCDGFFDCASVLSKSVAEMTFSLAYVLNVAFVALYHISEIGRRADGVLCIRLWSLIEKRVQDVVRSVMKEQVLHLFL